MNRINRAIRLCDRFLECVNQTGIANTIKIFSYLLSKTDTKKHIFVHGRFFYFYPRSDKGVISHMYKPGYKIIGDVKLIFDIGANIGDETLRFRHFNPKARIVAVEASARNYKLLSENFSGDDSVDLVHGALWHETGSIKLLSGSNFESFYVDKSKHSDSFKQSNNVFVSAYTVVDLMKKFGLLGMQIDVFKIDIEGAEEFIFTQGDTQWLNYVNVFIMEMPDNDRAGSFQRIMTHLSTMDIWGSSYICGENYVFCKSGCNLRLVELIGLGA